MLRWRVTRALVAAALGGGTFLSFVILVQRTWPPSDVITVASWTIVTAYLGMDDGWEGGRHRRGDVRRFPVWLRNQILVSVQTLAGLGAISATVALFFVHRGNLVEKIVALFVSVVLFVLIDIYLGPPPAPEDSREEALGDGAEQEGKREIT